MSATPNLGLPYIDAGQAQKHVTHNEALRLLDALTQLAVVDRDLSAPPETPLEGQRWIVKAAATDAWTGRENHIAAWQDGAWQFSAPAAGWVAYVIDEEILAAWDGSAWSAVSAGEGGGGDDEITELQEMSLLGIGTTADSTNPLSATLNNVLWAAKTVADGGDGTLRYKLSKESADKTLSFLFQDDFEGCAEIGLTGDDDFHFKVSPDGTAWLESIRIDRATGMVSFPSGGAREVLAADRTYYVDPANGSDGSNGLSSGSGAFATIAHALDVASALDLSIYNVTIQLANGTYTTPIVAKSFVGAGSITFKGDSTTPSNVTIAVSGTNTSAFNADSVLGKYILDGMKLTASGTGASYGIFAQKNVAVEYRNCEFGAANAQIRAAYGAIVTATGPYKISGGAGYHLSAVYGAGILINGVTITLTGTPNFTSFFANAQLVGFLGSVLIWIFGRFKANPNPNRSNNYGKCQ